MTADEFSLICGKLRPFTDYLYFHVMGEPLLHPDLERFLEIAAGYGFRVCITTNGTLLRERGEVLLKHSGAVHKVSISLHSMEGNGAEEELADYLMTAVTFAQKAAAAGIHTVFRLWNLDAEGKNGENRENQRIESFLHEQFPGEWGKRWNGLRLAKSIFLEYAGIFTWPSESDAEAVEDGYCHGLTDQIAVLADGTVVPCCLDSEGEIALGNLLREETEEILRSPRATAMREGFCQGRMTEPLCRTCTYARRFKK